MGTRRKEGTGHSGTLWAVGPSRDQAKLKVDQARSEQQARQQYQRFVGNKDTDTDVAVAAYRDLPETSVYRQLGRADYEKLRPQFITDHIEKAESALQNGRCPTESRICSRSLMSIRRTKEGDGPGQKPLRQERVAT